MPLCTRTLQTQRDNLLAGAFNRTAADHVACFSKTGIVHAMRIVAAGVNQQLTKDNGLILITHYQRLLDYIKPHFVHILLDGQIVESGGSELAEKLEEKGYDWVREKYAAPVA